MFQLDLAHQTHETHPNAFNAARSRRGATMLGMLLLMPFTLIRRQQRKVSESGVWCSVMKQKITQREKCGFLIWNKTLDYFIWYYTCRYIYIYTPIHVWGISVFIFKVVVVDHWGHLVSKGLELWVYISHCMLVRLVVHLELCRSYILPGSFPDSW